MTNASTQEQPINNYGYHLVAFLDILEQKDRLQKIDGIFDRSYEKSEIEETLKHTVGHVRYLRNHFKEIFYQFLNSEVTVSIDERHRETFNKLRSNTELHIQHLSDAVIIWTPVRPIYELEYVQTLNSIYTTLISAALAIQAMFARRCAIRGGIDLEGGVTIDPGGNEIYGPALNRAYHLESKCAKYPRILIGDGLVKFLDSVSKKDFHDDLINRYAKRMIKKCRSCITRDDYDGRNILHYLSPEMNEIANRNPELQSGSSMVLDWAKKFVSDNRERFKYDRKLGPRYRALFKYFERHTGSNHISSTNFLKIFFARLSNYTHTVWAKFF